jgi:hypothetical protein
VNSDRRDGQWTDEELGARAVAPDPHAATALRMARGTVAALVFGQWMLATCAIYPAFVLAPLGVLITAGLAVARWRGRRVTPYLLLAVVATAWPSCVVLAIVRPGAPPPAPVYVPGDLYGRQGGTAAASGEFLRIAHEQPDIGSFAAHLDPPIGVADLQPCWDATPRPVILLQQSGNAERQLDEGSAVVISLDYLVDGHSYEAELVAWPGGWRIHDVPRSPGAATCPVGYPDPPAYRWPSQLGG